MKNSYDKCNIIFSRIVFTRLFVIICSLLIVACSFSDYPQWGDNAEYTVPQGFGSFSLKITGAQRTLLPSSPLLDDFAVLELVFTNTENSSETTTVYRNIVNSGGVLETVVLPIGTYTLTVNAYLDMERNNLAARGIAEDTVTITSGGNTSAEVRLKALLLEGTGTFNWNVNITAAGVTEAAMTIRKNDIIVSGIGGNPVDLLSTASGYFTLSSGVYNVSFKLVKGGTKEESVWNEILYIYSSLESKCEKTFDDDFFYHTHYNVIFNYNYDDITVTQSVEHGGLVSEPENPLRIGWTFDGWRTAETDGVKWDFDTQVSDDFVLYAQWYYVHNWGEWETTTPATCIAPGVETRVCTLDPTHIETRPIPINLDAHDWGNWGESTATFIEAGIETRRCNHNSSHIETRNIGQRLITTTSEWYTALAQLIGRTGEYTLIISGIIDTLGRTTNSFGDTIGGSSLIVTLQSETGNTNELRLSSNGSLLRLGANQTLLINSADLTLRGRGSNNNNNSSLIVIEGGAELILQRGSITSGIIANTNATSTTNLYGGGVRVAGGTFIMNGGTISGSATVNTNNGTARAGGGGVYMTGGTFIMTGGTINGSARAQSTSIIGTASAFALGGGVYITGGTFTITGGTISGTVSASNSAAGGSSSARGGGLYVSGSTLRIQTGTISGGAEFASTATAQRGIFNGDTWVSYGNLVSTWPLNNTINVVNGMLQ